MYLRVPQKWWNLELQIKVPEAVVPDRVPSRTTGYPGIPPGTFAYRPAILLMDENRLSGRPSSTNWGCLGIQNEMEADGRAIVRRFRYPDARVRHGKYKRGRRPTDVGDC